MRRLCLFLAVLIATTASVQAAEPVTPAEALNLIGTTASVAMQVKSTHVQRGLHLLNSETDFKTDGNFTVFIGTSAMKKFEEAGIKNPSEHYKDKKIVVTGMLQKYGRQAQIHVTGPDDVKISEK